MTIELTGIGKNLSKDHVRSVVINMLSNNISEKNITGTIKITKQSIDSFSLQAGKEYCGRVLINVTDIFAASMII